MAAPVRHAAAGEPRRASRRGGRGPAPVLLLVLLAAGLLGALAVTGRWPGGAALDRFAPNGILAAAPSASRVEIAANGGHLAVRRDGAGWAVEGLAAEAAGQPVARHVDTGLRFLAVSAPLRVIGAEERDEGSLAAFGLDPPGLIVWVAGVDSAVARIGFGALNPAQTSQYVRVEGRPEVYLLPRHVGAEWRLAADRAARAGVGAVAAGAPLLPVSIAQVWAVEVVAAGRLARFERDGEGAWLHHVGRHEHRGPADVHRADPVQAPRIAAELGALERARAAATVAASSDPETLARTGLARPGLILLLYARDNPTPVARLDIGAEAPGGGAQRYARLHGGGGPVVTADAPALDHLGALLRIAGP